MWAPAFFMHHNSFIATVWGLFEQNLNNDFGDFWHRDSLTANFDMDIIILWCFNHFLFGLFIFLKNSFFLGLLVLTAVLWLDRCEVDNVSRVNKGNKPLKNSTQLFHEFFFERFFFYLRRCWLKLFLKILWLINKEFKFCAPYFQRRIKQ